MDYGISVIVPTYNEARYISGAIESFIDDLRKTQISYEIIVVDNLSSDNTESIVQTYPVRYLICNHRGSPAATRNYGAQSAKYQILCFIDGDCLVREGWFRQVLTALSDEKIGAYGGPALSPKEGNWIERTWAPTEIRPFYIERCAIPGANFSLLASTFNKVGGFDTDLTTAEDDDLSNRILRLGLNVVSDSSHPVIHLGYPKSLLEILKKQIWHGSSQLKAHGLFGDKVVLMTAVWITALLAIFFTHFFGQNLLYVNSFVLLLFPLIIAVKRTGKFKRISLTTLIRSYIISWFFLAGRGIGLCLEIFKRIKP